MILKNIEIKAHLINYDKTRALVETLCPKPESTEQQVDTFFITEKGRLKLREASTKSALIYYDRPDTVDPSPSDIAISFIDEPDTLKDVLSKSLGIRRLVKKERTLYLYIQTRIHLDKVEGLGNFLELEVVLKENQSEEDGKHIAQEIMNKLEINDSDLIEMAYVDLLDEAGK